MLLDWVRFPGLFYAVKQTTSKLWNDEFKIYGEVSKIFRTGAAIYGAVVVARSTDTNRPNREFRVLLRRFVVTAWKRAKTSPRSWREQTWLLHHDNAPSHTSVLTQQFLAKYNMAVIPHPPYSRDLTPCVFFLFPLTFWHPNLFNFLAHPVCKIWIIQEPKMVALWNKRHFEEKEMESVQHV
jgi:hypothetical protein